MGWRRAVVTRVWPNAGRDSTIKYHPVERDVVLLPKASLRTWNNHWGERVTREGLTFMLRSEDEKSQAR